MCLTIEVVAVWSCCGATAYAQCPVIDFEDLDPNTIVTTQYPGVTFSVLGLPPDCGASHCRIAVVPNGTASPTRALRVDNGSIGSPSCEFHPQRLRMVFDEPVAYVSFVVGPGTNEDFQDYAVLAYSATSGGTPILSTPVTNAGNGVFRFVELVAATPEIRRVEIEGKNGAFSQGVECIDNLQIGRDLTPPIARISAPASIDCGCEIINIEGEACDPDGAYGFDTAEYRLVSADPNDPWSLIGSFSSPLCGGGTLYVWDTTGLPEGLYYVRLTVQNACGLKAEDRIVIHVSRDFDEIEIREPEKGDKRGGVVCVDGTAWEWFCFQNYRVDYRPAGVGTYLPVDPGKPLYTERVMTDPLASWNTGGGAAPDGEYQLRVRGQTTCGLTKQQVNTITIDNTPAIAEITSPAHCEYVNGMVSVFGTAADANFVQYRLQYVGGGLGEWTTFHTGNTPVVGGLLGTWNTAQLPRCAYAIRLLVDTDVLMDCDEFQRSTDHALVIVACEGDINLDGKVNQADLGLLLATYGIPCP